MQKTEVVSTTRAAVLVPTATKLNESSSLCSSIGREHGGGTTGSTAGNSSKMKIAIIGGGGASGLATIRAFQKMNMQFQLQQLNNTNSHNNNNNLSNSGKGQLLYDLIEVTVFEKSNSIGGVWKYHHQKEQQRKDYPMYRNLRTNLPKELMAFREYPIWPQLTSTSSSSSSSSLLQQQQQKTEIKTETNYESINKNNYNNKNSTCTSRSKETSTTTTCATTTSNTSCSFVHHSVVLDYLQSYSDHYHLTEMIQFGCTVQKLTLILNIGSLSFKDNKNKDNAFTSSSRSSIHFYHDDPPSIAEQQKQHDDNNNNDNTRKITMSMSMIEELPKIELEWTTTTLAAPGKDIQSQDRQDCSAKDNGIDTTTTTTTTKIITKKDTFDGVVICNGHYNKPFIPKIPGLEEYYKGIVLHSIEYDTVQSLIQAVLTSSKTTSTLSSSSSSMSSTISPCNTNEKNSKNNKEQDSLQNLPIILCVGSRASGSDIAREIAQYYQNITSRSNNNNNNNNTTTSKQSKNKEQNQWTCTPRVYLSDSTYMDHVPITQYGVTLVPRTREVLMDGRIQFDHFDCTIENTPKVDVILFCTGYEYDFPFIQLQDQQQQHQKQEEEEAGTSNININSSVTSSHTDGSSSRSSSSDRVPLQLSTYSRCVTPLYKQLFHATYPNIAFIGLPHSIVPFPTFEIQAEAVAYQWTEWIRRKHYQHDDEQYFERTIPNNQSNDIKKKKLIQEKQELSPSSTSFLLSATTATTTTNTPTTTTRSVLFLPNVSERERSAVDDSKSGGPDPIHGRCPQDTHFLGPYQWDYCRNLARFGNIYDNVLEQYILTNKAIYDHVSQNRAVVNFPAGPDTYRNVCYKRALNNNNQKLHDDSQDPRFDVYNLDEI